MKDLEEYGKLAEGSIQTVSKVMRNPSCYLKVLEDVKTVVQSVQKVAKTFYSPLVTWLCDIKLYVLKLPIFKLYWLSLLKLLFSNPRRLHEENMSHKHSF